MGKTSVGHALTAAAWGTNITKQKKPNVKLARFRWMPMGRVDKAVQWAVSIANNNAHGYSQANRNGCPDYDCSSLTIAAFEWAGIPVGNATYTGNMYVEFICNGWQNVTSSVDLKTGNGLIPGDVLLNEACHTCIYIGGGRVVNARTDTDNRSGDSHGDEIRIQSYWNFPWDCVLRWDEELEPNLEPVCTKFFCDLDADGEFGRLTEQAVREFQKQNGLDADGICGEKTWTKIFEVIKTKQLRSGSVGWLVTALQAALNAIGEDT